MIIQNSFTKKEIEGKIELAGSDIHHIRAGSFMEGLDI
jgi:hypothetical protein